LHLLVDTYSLQVIFDSDTCAIRAARGKEEIDYVWLLNLAQQNPSNLKHLTKVTIIEDGGFTSEKGEDLDLLRGKNVSVAQLRSKNRYRDK
jgi:hypothetical protein